MSVLAGLYNVDFTVKRAGVTSDTASSTYTTIATYRGVFRPVTNQTQLFNADRQGREFKLWCDYTDNVLPNDTVTIDSVIYTVAGVNYYQDLEGNESHKEVRIFR